jgi:maltose O-acetyltransferase
MNNKAVLKFILKLMIHSFGIISRFYRIFFETPIIDNSRKLIYKYSLKSKADFGEKVTIHYSVYIRNPENLKVGDNSNINHGSELYCAGGVEIGKGSMISYHVVIMSDTREFMGVESLKGRTNRIKRKVEIGDDVWIGTKAMILPGISIGNHAIVAAGSVVTKNVKEWEIVAGNPARHIKFRNE